MWSGFLRILFFLGRSLNRLRKIIINLLFFGLIALLLIAFNHDDSPKIENDSALVLDLYGTVVEQKQQLDPRDNLITAIGGGYRQDEILLSDIIQTIDDAAIDPKISAIILNLDHLKRAGISKLQSIGDALNHFKKSGKPIIAMGNWYNQNQYFLASFADTIYLNPQGSVEINGLSQYRQYFKSALDKLKIKAYVFRVGTFKSAVEPYLRNNMSPAAKQANIELLNDIWSSYEETVNKNRKLKPKNLVLSSKRYIAELDKAKGRLATMAFNLGWVDKLASTEQFRLAMMTRFGHSDKANQFKQISFDDYRQLHKEPAKLSTKDTIGVIVAKGTILNGYKNEGQIGGQSTSELLRKARFDPKIKAVVLRVDSPGGSAFASEQIRQELLAVKAAGKPVVVSMGSYAASGGYWISASANYIYATPTTLTGSIGIFGMLTTIEDSLATIGIHTDGVATSQRAAYSPTKNITPEFKRIIQRQIERGYHDFISLVSTARGIPLAQVDKIAQGHVWSGKRALKLGLVDALGDIDDAVAKAAELAKLTKYNRQLITPDLPFEDQLIQKMLVSVQAYLPRPALQNSMVSLISSQWQNIIEQLNTFDDPNGVYLYCDSCNL